MDWRDEAIVLSVRPHGETSAIAELLTRDHGRHLGLVHGGRSRRTRPVLQPGNSVHAHWRARLADQLGRFHLELSCARAVFIMEEAGALAALGSLTQLCRLLAERDPHPRLYEALGVLLDVLAGGHEIARIAQLMLKFELGLLDELGFGLDLSRCAATGATKDLVYVSPRSGRAVSRSGGAPWRSRLLPLPGFLLGKGAEEVSLTDLKAGFALTGYFLERHLFAPRQQTLPEARTRFVHLLERSGGAG